MSPLVSTRLLERLALLDLGARRAGGGRGPGERMAGASGVGAIFREHRTYVPGDDLRYVDWNAYGRLRTLHVKVFEREESLDVHLLIDRSASMGRGPGSKLETALRLAAMVGSVALARSAGVRLQHLPTQGRLQAFEGRAGTNSLVAALGSTEPGGTEPLGRSLRGVFPRLRRRGFALLVSDFLDADDGPEGWQHAVDFLAYRRVELVAIHVVAPEERDPSVDGAVDGAVRLRDAETGDELLVDVDDARLVRYRERFAHRVRQVGAYLRAKEARHIVVESGASDEGVLLRRLLATGVLR